MKWILEDAVRFATLYEFLPPINQTYSKIYSTVKVAENKVNENDDVELTRRCKILTDFLVATCERDDISPIDMCRKALQTMAYVWGSTAAVPLDTVQDVQDAEKDILHPWTISSLLSSAPSSLQSSTSILESNSKLLENLGYYGPGVVSNIIIFCFQCQ